MALAPRSHKRAGPSPAFARYGPRRLGVLYEISKLLTRFVATVEETLPLLLALITEVLPLRSVILIEKAADRPKTVVWHAPQIAEEDRRSVEERALKSFAYLTGAAAPATTGGAGGAPLPPPTRGRFITCPLSVQGQPISGALHLEGVAPFDEEDVEFLSAIANQLAIALNLHHLNVGLERRVAERTAQFQDTIKELQAFTYSMAHDLRAPLRHINGFGRLLLGDVEAAARRGLVERIMAASASMDVLISDLLAYSRLTLEEVECGPISLSEVLDMIKISLESDLLERKARLEVQSPLPRVIGHELTLVQALVNLVSNAIKFVATGVEPRVRVWAENRGARVRLWVEDNGIGIAPEHQGRIFGVFQRLHRVEDYPGTGIGLAIVRRALERMKGLSGVESQPGQGSRFWIELARAPDAR